MSTKIEWTDETWNPTTGCTKVSQGCKHCYAERLWPKVEGARVAREGGAPRPFEEVRIHRDRVDKPLHWREPRMVFVNSMSDLFHDDVPWEFIDAVFGVMAVTTRHTYQILTKRPERMRAYIERLQGKTENELHFFPSRISHRAAEFLGRGSDNCGPRWPLENVWLGVSAEDQKTFDERWPHLRETPAAVRFLSAEPLLGPIDATHSCNGFEFSDALRGRKWHDADHGARAETTRLDWVITGGESGPKARASHPDHFRSLRDQCHAAGVPFFFKQWGEWGPTGHPPMMLNEPGTVQMQWFGKKRAGRLLDDVEHNEYPASPSTTTKEHQ
jgi:protein gp37